MRKLVDILKTPRRSVVALAEAKVLKDYIAKKGKCINCQEACTVDNASPRHNGACSTCGAMYDNMLTVKNKIVRGDLVGGKTLRRYLHNLENCRYLPASLRGMGTMEELISYMEDYISESEDKVSEATQANVSAGLQQLMDADEPESTEQRERD